MWINCKWKTYGMESLFFIFQDIFCDYPKLMVMDMEFSILFQWIHCVTMNSIMKFDDYVVV